MVCAGRHRGGARIPDDIQGGPGASASVFFVTPDDRFLVQPIQGVLSPGDASFDRDYPGEHSRRVIVLDIQKLVRARTLVKCDAPPVITDANGIIQRITARNNGAEDCPTVTGTLNLVFRSNQMIHCCASQHSGLPRSYAARLNHLIGSEH